jgi:DNA helicase-2/ATP-dependent DNA helicase PcrA
LAWVGEKRRWDPLKISSTGIVSYLKCPFYYKLRYVDRVQSPPKPHMKLGAVIHSVLREFHRYMAYGDPGIGKIIELYERFWPPSSGFLADLREAGMRMLEDYYMRNVGEFRPSLCVEEPFSLSLSGDVVTGRFDRVDGKGEGVEVVEYKISRETPSEEDVELSAQLNIYFLAARERFGACPVSLQYYYLRYGEKFVITKEDRDVGKALGALENVIGRIKSWDFTPREGKHCRRCDYKEYCPLKTENPKIPPSRFVQLELSL